MKKLSKLFFEHQLYSVICAVMVLALSMSISSCGDDEPENEGNGDTPQAGIVTESELAGEWTLVKDNVLYSQVNSQKGDETISYSGNSAPRYQFYNVSVTEDGIISMVEVSATGSVIGTPVEYTLEGNDLVTVKEKKIAGTIENYNPSHSWDNLRIKWNKDYSPIDFGAPVISTYML